MKNATPAIYLILTLGLLNALTPFTIDLYLPAFPVIAQDLGVEVQRISLTISIYFIGFAVGQLLYGPLLDRFGRKKPIFFGLALYSAASLGCFQAQSLEELLIFRFLSALGGSAASVGAMTMVRDYFPAKDAAKIFSMLMLVLSASPLLAPSVGGIIVSQIGWRAIFLTLTMLAALNAALVAFVLPLAYQPNLAISLRPLPILREFWSILQVREFWVPTIVGSLSFAGLFVFVAGSPAIFMQGFGVSAQSFGIIFAILAGGMIGGGQLNQLLMRKFSSALIFRTTLSAQCIIGVIFLALTLIGQPDLISTIVLIFLVLATAGIAYPNAAALALEPFSKNIGSASALLGFLQLGLGSLVSAGLGIFKTKGVLPMAATIAISSALGWLILLLTKYAKTTANRPGSLTLNADQTHLH